MSAASGGNSDPKQGQRSQSAMGFCPRSTMRVPQPGIIEHFGNADAVPQLPERCLSRKAGIVRYCPNICVCNLFCLPQNCKALCTQHQLIALHFGFADHMQHAGTVFQLQGQFCFLAGGFTAQISLPRSQANGR